MMRKWMVLTMILVQMGKSQGQESVMDKVLCDGFGDPEIIQCGPNGIIDVHSVTVAVLDLDNPGSCNKTDILPRIQSLTEECKTSMKTQVSDQVYRRCHGKPKCDISYSTIRWNNLSRECGNPNVLWFNYSCHHVNINSSRVVVLPVNLTDFKVVDGGKFDIFSPYYPCFVPVNNQTNMTMKCDFTPLRTNEVHFNFTAKLVRISQNDPYCGDKLYLRAGRRYKDYCGLVQQNYEVWNDKTIDDDIPNRSIIPINGDSFQVDFRIANGSAGGNFWISVEVLEDDVPRDLKVFCSASNLPPKPPSDCIPLTDTVATATEPTTTTTTPDITTTSTKEAATTTTTTITTEATTETTVATTAATTTKPPPPTTTTTTTVTTTASTTTTTRTTQLDQTATSTSESTSTFATEAETSSTASTTKSVSVHASKEVKDDKESSEGLLLGVLLGVIVLVVIVAVIAAVLFFIFRKKKKEQKADAPPELPPRKSQLQESTNLVLPSLQKPLNPVAIEEKTKPKPQKPQKPPIAPKPKSSKTVSLREPTRSRSGTGNGGGGHRENVAVVEPFEVYATVDKTKKGKHSAPPEGAAVELYAIPNKKKPKAELKCAVHDETIMWENDDLYETTNNLKNEKLKDSRSEKEEETIMCENDELYSVAMAIDDKKEETGGLSESKTDLYDDVDFSGSK